MKRCKAYMRVDYPDDDIIIAAMLAAADSYLSGAGIERDKAAQLYDLIAFDMTLRIYDGRENDAAHAATAPLVRQMLTQLKLICNYGGGADG